MIEAIAISVVALAALGLIAWLVYNGNDRTNQMIAAGDVVAKTREQLDAALLDAERAKFELAQAQQTLASETARANALEEAIGKDINATPNSDLAADDVLGRVVRMSKQWGATNVPSAAGQIPAVAVGDVHAPASAAGTVAAAVPKP